MPSTSHEALVLLFRNRPTLAAELLRDVFHVRLPECREARIGSADFNEMRIAEYRADLLVELVNDEQRDGGDARVGGIVVEAQRSRDEDKRASWPAYVAIMRSRLKRGADLLVVTQDEFVERWASQPIELGGNNFFTPTVAGPSTLPEVTDPFVAESNPELAVLSAVVHGRSKDAVKAARIAAVARAACRDLDLDRSRLYFDFILASLSEAVTQELELMEPAKYEYQSEFAKRYIALGKEEGKAEGKAEGITEGRAELIRRLLTLRFGALSADAGAHIAAASVEELDAIGERLLTAHTLDEALEQR